MNDIKKPVFPVAEKFISINGESTRAGEPAVFIRFRGCNLNCTYCDTSWANSPDVPAEMTDAAELACYVRQTGITNVTLTGGEPLLQKDIAVLIGLLIDRGHRVEIETNGSIMIYPVIKELTMNGHKLENLSFTLDYKLPGSGMAERMLTANYDHLTLKDTVKFVAGSREDLEKALEVINTFGLAGKCRLYISPVFGKINPEEIVDFMLDNKMNDVRLQLQLHKYIWDPDKRGV